AGDVMPPERSSLPAVDYIKSVAILAVLVQHAVPSFLDQPFTPELATIYGSVCFHVPAFLFLAGFLTRAEATVTWRDVGARLQRIVPPYLVATAFAVACGFVAPLGLRRLIFVTVMGAALGHYYFVPVLIFCLLLLPAFSRMSTPALIGGTLLILVAAQYMWLSLEWRLAHEIFWQIRNPILQFHLGFFLLGMIAARLRPTLERLATRHRFAILGTAAVSVPLFVGFGSVNEVIFQPTTHAAYTLLVMGLIASAVTREPAPTWIRFLSEATFTIYLYHLFAYKAVGSLMPSDTPLILRVAVLMSAGLAFSTLIALLGRRALGARSRLLLGT
ncbi:MAG: acyltransferase, partial [Candidatus Binatia bacterium]